ncbi:alpha/beta fold hydrolase [Streptomyces sp. NPDC058195]|uniref:alpha/beta fold hydrolase n=1 Tax=Streptomyces sp. NPDC058195 TaxID=3346375 RepID=UPI0036E54F5E
MPTFSAPDGVRLAYRVHGDGAPLVCVPGGPADSRYLGDLGGLPAHRRLIVLDLRGTGRSALPGDVSSYRCDRLAEDVEALRVHLGLPVIDLLGHSAGTDIVTQYAARHPGNVGRLVLVAPGGRSLGITVSARSRRELALLRAHEPWFPAAFAALEAVLEGTGSDWAAVDPFFCGRWDGPARRHRAASRPDNAQALAQFAAGDAFTPGATRAALAALAAPVLLLAGELDLNSPPGTVAEAAGLFPRGRLSVQPGAGHCPWTDDADRFASAVAAFLA